MHRFPALLEGGIEGKKDVQDPIISAVLFRDMARLEKALTKRRNGVFRKDHVQWTALHYAARGDFLSGAEKLIEIGAPVNCRDETGFTPLHIAVCNQSQKVTELLAKARGINIEATTISRQTPLHLAAMDNLLNIVKILVEAGANINSVDRHSSTPLHYCLKSGNIELAKYLVLNGADPNITNKFGEFPYDHISNGEVRQDFITYVKQGEILELQDDQESFLFWTPCQIVENVVSLLGQPFQQPGELARVRPPAKKRRRLSTQT